MADEWIKMRKKLLRDGRVLNVSRICHAQRVTVIGALFVLWSLADDYAESDGLLCGYTPSDLDREVEIAGFTVALPPDWCVLREGLIYLPNYQEHNGATAKQRAKANVRQQALRQRKDVSRTKRDKNATREEKRREERIRRSSFIRPTIEQVRSYCRERGNTVDPQRWMDHYESNGWKVGKNPMKDWKAAVRTWEKNDYGRANGRSGGGVGPPTRVTASDAKLSIYDALTARVDLSAPESEAAARLDAAFDQAARARAHGAPSGNPPADHG